MKISIVIPVYNEEDHLASCLNAIAAQSRNPYEVIVVDNNSTDNSAVIAGKYSFVTLINEPKQGVVHARTTGFEFASGNILARIDADSIIPVNWLETIENIFTNTQASAVTGQAWYYSVAANEFVNNLDLFLRRRLSRTLNNRMYLWGANMAMTKSAWKSVKPLLCNKAFIHEDFDISIHLQEKGYQVEFDERLGAFVSARRIDTDFISYLKYVFRNPNTYKKHGINVNKEMFLPILISVAGYLPGRLLYRGYCESTGKFKLVNLLNNKNQIARVDPTANVV